MEYTLDLSECANTSATPDYDLQFCDVDIAEITTITIDGGTVSDEVLNLKGLA